MIENSSSLMNDLRGKGCLVLHVPIKFGSERLDFILHSVVFTDNHLVPVYNQRASAKLEQGKEFCLGSKTMSCLQMERLPLTSTPR